MLKFYWPFSLIGFFITVLFSSVEMGFYVASGIEVIGLIIILLGISKSREVSSFSLTGLFLDQFFFGDVVVIEEIIAAACIRLVGYLLGIAAIWLYIPTIVLILYSTVNPPIDQNEEA